MISKEKARENVAVVTAQLEEGVKNVFESTRYKEYLSCLSKFHKYSFNNVLLIYLQYPQASIVAGFNDWKNKHNRYVKKGEKAIRILAPIIEKQDVEVPIKDENGRVIEINGKALTEIKQKSIVYGFRPVSVFDISQTDGEPLHSLGQELTQGVENYEDIMKCIISLSPYPIRFQEINSGAKGYCSYSEEIIAIREGMSAAQTIKTALHEVAHAMLHNPKVVDTELTRAEKEVQAESVAFVVSNYLGIDTSDYSFDYVAVWSQNKELEDLKNSLDVIQKTSKEILTRLTEEYGDILQVQEVEYSADVEDLRNINEVTPSIEKAEIVTNIDEEHTPTQPRYSKEENEQIISRIKSDIRISDYAQKLGYTILRVGKYLSLKEHDSVRIDVSQNRFVRNSTGAKGSIIDFVMEFEKLDKTSAIRKLIEYGNITPNSPAPMAHVVNEIKKEMPLVLPQKDNSYRNVYAYLLKTRHISRDVVDSWKAQGLLYQDIHKNCVFVSYDKTGNPVFASLKGTNTSKSFAGDIEGCNYDICHFFNSGAKSLIVCEAVIDLMSVQTILLQNGRSLSDYNYLSLNGTSKVRSILHALKESPVNKVILAVDNDIAGETARLKLRELICDVNPDIQIIDYIPPNEKDWNEELVAQFQSKELKQDTLKKGISELQNEATTISEKLNQQNVNRSTSQNQEINQGE